MYGQKLDPCQTPETSIPSLLDSCSSDIDLLLEAVYILRRPTTVYRYPVLMFCQRPWHQFQPLSLYVHNVQSKRSLFQVPTMFTKNLSIFVLLLTTFSLFNHGKAISSPLFRRTLLPESSPPALDVLENLPPNAKRLALGLPPLAPFRRWTPSATDNSAFRVLLFTSDIPTQHFVLVVKRAEPSPVP